MRPSQRSLPAGRTTSIATSPPSPWSAVGACGPSNCCGSFRHFRVLTLRQHVHFRRCRAYFISKAKTWSRTSTVVVALLQLLSREQWTARERTSAHVAILGGHVQVLRVLGDETRLEDADEDVAEALACLEGAVWVAHLWRGVPLEH